MDELEAIRARLRLGDAQACVSPLQAWLGLASPDDPDLAEAWLLLANALQEMPGWAEEQLAAAQQAADLADRQGHLALLSRATTMLSAAHYRLGLHSESADLAMRAVQQARQAADPGAEAEALLRLSRAPMAAGDFPEAERLLQASLACARIVADPVAMFWPLNNLSHILGQRAEQLAEAGDRSAASARVAELQQVADQALALARASGHRLQEAFALANLADAYIIEGDLPRARSGIQAYRALATDIGSNRLVGYAYLDDVRLLRAQSQLDDAIAVLMDPAFEARIVHEDDLAALRREMLYKLHKEAGRHDVALRYHEEWAAAQIAALTLRADKQQRVLLARIDLEHARAVADKARLEAQAQRDLAAAMALERDRHREASRRDPLTGVGNRRAADEDLAQRLQETSAQTEHLFAALLDIDHFKRINDTWGHAQGDAVLVALAKLLLDLLRGRDRVYRIGGEEFLVLLTDASTSAGLDASERLRLGVQQAPWSALGAGLAVTASVGVAKLLPGDTATALLARADKALYQAKEGGRNQVVEL